MCRECKIQLHTFNRFKQKVRKGYNKPRGDSHVLLNEELKFEVFDANEAVSEEITVEVGEDASLEDPTFSVNEETAEEAVYEFVSVEDPISVIDLEEKSTFETVDEFDLRCAETSKEPEVTVVKDEYQINQEMNDEEFGAETDQRVYGGNSSTFNSSQKIIINQNAKKVQDLRQKELQEKSTSVKRLDKPRTKSKKKKVKVFVFECEYCPLTTR